VAGAVAGAAAGILGSSLAGARSPRQLTEGQILQLALGAAARSGDPRPTLIQHSEGPLGKANQITAGAYIGGSAQSYLIAARGQFIGYGAPIPAGAPLPRGTVITLIVNAATGRVTDDGITNRYPRLAQLGPVTTDFRSYQSCPPTDRHSLTSTTRGAKAMLVPATARQVLLCRYHGANPKPSESSYLAAQRLVLHRRTVRRLAREFDALMPQPPGVFACPIDTGIEIIAIFRYRARSDDPVTLAPGGCASATNGHLVRSAMYPPGPRLIKQLDALTTGR